MTAHVDELGVAARAQRRGHGRALMRAAEAHAHAWGAVALTLDAQAFNAGALAFYEAIGFAAVTVRLSKPL